MHKTDKPNLSHRLIHRQKFQPPFKLLKTDCFWASYGNRLSRKYIHKIIRELYFAVGAG